VSTLSGLFWSSCHTWHNQSAKKECSKQIGGVILIILEKLKSFSNTIICCMSHMKLETPKQNWLVEKLVLAIKFVRQIVCVFSEIISCITKSKTTVKNVDSEFRCGLWRFSIFLSYQFLIWKRGPRINKREIKRRSKKPSINKRRKTDVNGQESVVEERENFRWFVLCELQDIKGFRKKLYYRNFRFR
jgi:hypothetical protein